MTTYSVLIVEDELIVQMHLTQIVSGLGHDVIGTASTTEEALAAAERRPPDLVLMDVRLAGGGDGVETARLLRERFDCAVVFVTAHADSETVARTESVVPGGYVVKPFTSPEVRAAITTAMTGHGHLRRARERERSLASLLVDKGDAVFVAGADGAISYVNPKAVDLTGWKAHEAVDRHLLDVLAFSSDDAQTAVRETLARTLASGEPAAFVRLEIRTRDGHRRMAGVAIEPIVEEGAAPSGLVVTLRDRTARAERVAASGSSKPFGADTRLLVYSHDTLGLGHLRRCLNLIRALAARHPDLSTLLVTGSPMAHRYPLPPGTDYLKLPAVRKVAPDSYEARSLSMSDKGIRDLRSNLLLRTIRDYDPNVLLVDHSPVGMKGEMLPALEWLAGQGRCTRILGLRDIIDEPAGVIEQWRAKGVYDVLRELYDHIVVYGAQPIYDTLAAYAIPADVAVKTRFVNYVCRQPEAADTPVEGHGNRPVVAVSIGGGDGGADTVVAPMLDMLQRYRADIDFHVELLTGPLGNADVERRLRSQAAGLPMGIKTFLPEPQTLYGQADLVVATAGYNTTTELLAFAKRAILIPRVLHRHEQLIRARRMEELGLVTCLHPDEVTPERLLTAIQDALGTPDEPLTRARADGVVPLDGADRFADFCTTLLVASRTSVPI